MRKKTLLICAAALTVLAVVFAVRMAVRPQSGTGAALPAKGEVVHGFRAVDVRPYEGVGGQVVLFEHEKTGARLFYIANEDTNRLFDLTFFTHAIDDTGLPHVFEHATLSGSEKYPSEKLFFNLLYQTYNTYMNAETASRATSYPVSSLSEEQLLRYADFYTDSCLHPSILHDESIFRREGWRYRMEDEDAPLTLEGTVYSEMLGNETLVAQADRNFLADAFPGSWVRFNHGGNPDEIPNMSFESLRAYHDKFYHPSNCAAFLYGRFDDYGAFLELLDKEFSAFEKRSFEVDDSGYTPLDQSVENSWKYPATAGEQADGGSCVSYGYVLPELTDDAERMRLSMASEFLANRVNKELKEALPGVDATCRLELSGPAPAMVFTVTSVNADDAKTVRTLVDRAVEGLAKDGIPESEATFVANRALMEERQKRSQPDTGLTTVQDMATNLAVYSDPWTTIAMDEGYGKIAEWCKDGSLASLIGKWLRPDGITVLSTTVPDPGAKEKKDEALAKKLEETKKAMSDDEKKAIIEASAASEPGNGAQTGDALATGPEQPMEAMEPMSGDEAQLLKQLQAVSPSTLPEELPEVKVTDQTDAQGVRHVHSAADVKGLARVRILLDAQGLSLEDLHWLQLLATVQNGVDSTQHSVDELDELGKSCFGICSSSCVVLNEGGKGHPYLAMEWEALTENMESCFGLADELFFDSAIDSEHADQIRTELATHANDGEVLFMMGDMTMPYLVSECLSDANGKAALKNEMDGLRDYDFTKKAAEMMDEDPERVIGELARVRDLIKNRRGAIVELAGDSSCFDQCDRLAGELLGTLRDEDVQPAEYRCEPAPDSAALVVDGDVNYNGYAASFDTLGMDGYDAGMEVVGAAVCDAFLKPRLRDQYGAYNVEITSYEEKGMSMTSFRDPRMAETFELYKELPDFLRQLDMDQEKLDGYILSTYSKTLLQWGAFGNAKQAAEDHLNGKDPNSLQTKLRQIKSVTPKTIKDSADIFERLVNDGRRIAAGGSKAIEDNEDLFDEVITLK